jgi:hypothetical protein
VINSINDQFNHGHGSGITGSGPQFDNPGVSTLTAAKLVYSVIEQLMYHILFSDDGKGLTSGMEITPFGQCDHLVSQFPELFGFGIGGFDSLVFKKRGDHISKHRLSMA